LPPKATVSDRGATCRDGPQGDIALHTDWLEKARPDRRISGLKTRWHIRFIAKGSGLRIQPYITPALAGFMITIIQTSLVMAAEIKVLSTPASTNA
jgi:hypothetical protein